LKFFQNQKGWIGLVSNKAVKKIDTYYLETQEEGGRDEEEEEEKEKGFHC
jgi:hypothetical protein